MINIFILLEGESEEEDKLWVAKILLFFRVKVRGTKEERKCPFLKYMECIPPCYNVDKVLGCTSLRWSTNNDRDHSLM